jgi:heparinase II/III-like protein
MFLDQYDKEYLLKAFLPLDKWQPFPTADDRQSWDRLLEEPLNKQRKEYILEQANAITSTDWPQLPASLYMEFHRNGNRRRYEVPYFERRKRLATLIIAECMSYQGKYINEIVNGIWCILEELTWCIPAHAKHLPNDPLPDNQLESVDLFASETAMVLSEALYLLKKPLEKLSPSLCERLRQAVINRVIIPTEERTDFFWMTGANNWTPWCSSNVLTAAMYVLDNPDRLAVLSAKLIKAVDLFIKNYEDDGGCDEGPGYWGVAAGAMLLFLELLYSRSNGKINIYDEPRIQSMGQFFVKAHLSGPWFINFADALAKMNPRRAVLYQYGMRIKDKSMQDTALLSAHDWDKNNPISTLFNQNITGGDLTHMLRELFWIPATAEPDALQPPPHTWLPDLQVLVARESNVDSDGLILAAKGGHNGESHNHNDIGQFVLFLDGQPGIVDIGVEMYRKETFSSSRYDIWTIRSSGHNVPQINGIEQSCGTEHCAENVEFNETPTQTYLSMNLKDAYPADAGIRSFRREFVFNHNCINNRNIKSENYAQNTQKDIPNKNALVHNHEKPAFVEIKDSFETDSGIPPSITIPLFCKESVEIDKPGKLLIATTPRPLVLEYSPDLLQAEISTIPIEDEKLNKVWGTTLFRIEFQYIGKKQLDSYELRFRAQHS